MSRMGDKFHAEQESAFLRGTAELRDELAPTHKEMAEMAVRYAALKEAESGIKKQTDAMRNELLRWVELNGPQTIEGAGTFRIQERSSYSYDVKAIREQEPQRFQELLELDCVEISRTKAKVHERLSWLKAWEIQGGTTALVIDKER